MYIHYNQFFPGNKGIGRLTAAKISELLMLLEFVMTYFTPTEWS